jgi:hypothetical protein
MMQSTTRMSVASQKTSDTTVEVAASRLILRMQTMQVSTLATRNPLKFTSCICCLLRRKTKYQNGASV